MPSFRVGTLSAGVLFIALGVGLLLQLFIPFSVVESVFTWWPFFLILIGAEILWSLRKTKGDEQRRMGYDFLSLFILIAFSIATLFLYAIQESGVYHFVKQMATTQTFDLQTAPEIIEIPSEVDHVTILGSSRGLKLETSEKNHMTIHTQWQNVYTEKDEDAKEFLQQVVSTKINGNVLYVTLNGIDSNHPFLPQASGKISIQIPAHLSVETEFSRGEIELNVTTFKTDWRIKSDEGSSVWVRLHNSVDASVVAHTFDGHIENNKNFWTTINEQRTKAEKVQQNAPTLFIDTKSGFIQVEEVK